MFTVGSESTTCAFSMPSARNALIIGANGALGRDVLLAFNRHGWSTFSVDLKANTAASLGSSIIVPGSTIPVMQQSVLKDLKALDKTFNAVINVAGGWAGGDVSSEECAAATQLMLEQSVYSSVVAAHITSHFALSKALLVLPGSTAALGPTSFMAGYGLAKAAVHHLVKSVAADPKVLPPGATVLGVLPATLDTPGNRAGMPNADFSTWTPTSEAAANIVSWAETPESRPASGSLVSWVTVGGKTVTSVVG